MDMHVLYVHIRKSQYEKISANILYNNNNLLKATMVQTLQSDFSKQNIREWRYHTMSSKAMNM